MIYCLTKVVFLCTKVAKEKQIKYTAIIYIIHWKEKNMKISKSCKFIFKITILICCLTGLIIKTGLIAADLKLYTLIYFTNQSNLLVLIVYLVSIFFKISRKNNFYNFFYGLALINILITFATYFLVLAPTMFQMYGAGLNFDSLGNMLLHLIVPMLMLMDFLVISDKNEFHYFYILLWICSLICYFVFLIIQAKLGGYIPNQNTKYPYEFIAVDLLGWDRTLKNGSLVLVSYFLISSLIIYISKVINQQKCKNK